MVGDEGRERMFGLFAGIGFVEGQVAGKREFRNFLSGHQLSLGMVHSSLTRRLGGDCGPVQDQNAVPVGAMVLYSCSFT